MIGFIKELLQQLIDHRRSLGCGHETRKVYYIVHQESLRTKAAGIKDIMFVVSSSTCAKLQRLITAICL